MPPVGAVAYLMFGEVRLGSRRVRRHAEVRREIHALPNWHREASASFEGRDEQIAELARRVGCPPRAGNEVRISGDPAVGIDWLIDAIDGAARHCHIQSYIYRPDDTGTRVAEALERAVERGVLCRLLVDSFGSVSFLGSSLEKRLEEAGIEVVDSLPAGKIRRGFSRIDVRNHRKLSVIDGEIAFTGSRNLTDPGDGDERFFDLMMRIEGPAVGDLQRLFLEDWYLDSGELDEALLDDMPEPRGGGVPVQVIGTGPNSNNQALVQLIQALCHGALRELIVTTPYFCPDEGTLSALCTAAARGVEVKLIVPRTSDSKLVTAATRSFYQALLDAGVEIYEFEGGVLHTKTLIIDRRISIVTTANMDRRSFEINFETTTVVYDPCFADELRRLQAEYARDSRQIDCRRWRERPRYQRLLQNAAGTFGSVL